MSYSEMKALENERDWSRMRAEVEARGLARPVRAPWVGLLIVMVLGVLVMGCAGPVYRDTERPISSEGPVDLERYQGLWYEIARFPNRFEEGCVGVTAEYSLNQDGTVRVLNTCLEGALDGPVTTAEGVATATTPDNDRLEVSFVPWLPFAKGDYWILDLTPDYSVAVIGTPAGSTGWVLARTPQIPEPALEAALEVLRQNGYDTGQIYMTPQADG